MLIVLVGPSGVGKSTLATGLYKVLPDAKLLPSFTTRPPRSSDKEHTGELNFVTKQDFDTYRTNGEFIWTVQPFNQPHWYGTRRADVIVALTRGVSVAVLTGDAPAMLHGYATACSLEKHVIYFYLMLDDMVELRRRLERDGTRADIEARLASASSENLLVCASTLPYRYLDMQQTEKHVLDTALAIIYRLSRTM